MKSTTLQNAYNEIIDILLMAKTVAEDDDVYTCEQAQQLIAENFWVADTILDSPELIRRMWREWNRIDVIKAKLKKAEEGAK